MSIDKQWVRQNMIYFYPEGLIEANTRLVRRWVVRTLRQIQSESLADLSATLTDKVRGVIEASVIESQPMGEPLTSTCKRGGVDTFRWRLGGNSHLGGTSGG